MTEERKPVDSQIIDPLPDVVMEAINAYGRYYAKEHNLGMSVRDDMKYVASVAMRWKPQITILGDGGFDLAQELRTVLAWESKRMGAMSVGVLKQVIARIEALCDMALRACDAPALSAQGPVAWRYRYSTTGECRYVEKEEHCNDRPSYQREPLYASPPPEQQGPTKEEVRIATEYLSKPQVYNYDVAAVMRAVLRMAGK